MREITERYTTTKYPALGQAQRERNARAKALRLAGYSVTCRKWGFQDLARAEDFTLTIHLDDCQPSPEVRS